MKNPHIKILFLMSMLPILATAQLFDDVEKKESIADKKIHAVVYIDGFFTSHSMSSDFDPVSRQNLILISDISFSFGLGTKLLYNIDQFSIGLKLGYLNINSTLTGTLTTPIPELMTEDIEFKNTFGLFSIHPRAELKFAQNSSGTIYWGISAGPTLVFGEIANSDPENFFSFETDIGYLITLSDKVSLDLSVPFSFGSFTSQFQETEIKSTLFMFGLRAGLRF